MRKRTVCLVLAALLALTLCTGAALAWYQPEAAAAIAVEGVDALYHHGHGHHGGGHHGGCDHHGSDCQCEVEECDWLFRTYGRCKDVNCTKKSHSHHCDVDCTTEWHKHYSVCQYEDGTLMLGEKIA